jgi:CTP:molybdopterin cytidylyltransferase MocA
MICAVVLAAGRSQRMGTHKLLLDCGGKPLIAHVVDQLLAAKVLGGQNGSHELSSPDHSHELSRPDNSDELSFPRKRESTVHKQQLSSLVNQGQPAGLDHIYVVTGHNLDAVAGAMAGRNVTLTVNPDYEQGMLSSIRCGFAAVPEECSALLVTLGDQPAITGDLVNRLIDAHTRTQKGIVVPVYNGRRGHPTLIAAKYRHAVMTQYDNVGLRGLLHEHPDDILELPVPDLDITADLDTPEDYARHLRNKNHTPHTT